MIRNIVWCGGVLAALVAAAPSPVAAQTIGTFKWQLQPYCNVVTLAISQVGGVYRLEGTDDQCGNGADKASAMGTAFPNPDGTIGFGLTIVATPGGVPVHVDAALAPGGFDGTWKDSAGNSGAFRLTPGAGTGGAARPLPLPPAAEVPPAIGLRSDGSIVANSTRNAPSPASGPGLRMMWHGGKAAFRAGGVDGTRWDDANVGFGSTAFGLDTQAAGRGSFAAGVSTTAPGEAAVAVGLRSSATGVGAFAFGQYTVASGPLSLAGGFSTSAIGLNSVALGDLTQATATTSTALGFRSMATGNSALAVGSDAVSSGPASMALGEQARAHGPSSVAMGFRVEAAGSRSVVLGSEARTTTNGIGSFVFGDASTPLIESAGRNEFVSRFAGGYYFFSNAALSAGARLLPGANAWSSLSDVNSKENFRDLSGDDVLAKIAAMPIREWNYKSQEASIRHMGPTAQDFHAAFGLGEDPLRISTIDADGVALAGVQALEARSRRQRHEYAALLARFEALDAVVATLQAELADARAAAAVPRVTRVAEVRRAWEGQEAVPAHGDSRVALSGLDGGLADWMAAVLAAIGIALAWVLAARGPFV